MIEAAKLIARWDPDNDHTKCLQKLKRSLEFQTGYIEHTLTIMSPPGSHRSAWALRYLVGIIDFHGSGRVRTADLARLATVAFGYEDQRKDGPARCGNDGWESPDQQIKRDWSPHTILA
jgi:hypothetical protein